MRPNILRLTDAYKKTHWLCDPPGLQTKFSYMESRGGKFSEVRWYGLQAQLAKYLEGPVLEPWMLKEDEEQDKEVFGTDMYHNRKGYEYILNQLGGHWPVRICAVPEGMLVPTSQVLLTVENTDPNCPFATNFIEDLLMQCWLNIALHASNSMYESF